MCRSISFYSPSLCSSPNHYVGRGTTVQWAAPCVVTETGRNKLKREKRMPKMCQNLEKYRRIVTSGGKPGEGNERLDLDPGGLA